jgi:hypothetical protein
MQSDDLEKLMTYEYISFNNYTRELVIYHKWQVELNKLKMKNYRYLQCLIAFVTSAYKVV